jgi:peptidoglycan/xylan/chitin deacetylase (PgdA/CDA1 family)
LAIFFTVLTFGQPKISLSFDDGSTADMPGYSFPEWNQLLLGKLRDNDIKSVLFVSGRGKSNMKGKYLLQSWDDHGHLIANHTVNHPNYNDPDITLEKFRKELRNNDTLIRKYSNYTKLFRFPYLKEGGTKEKVGAFRSFLQSEGYKNGYVTIDASDWYVNSRMLKRLNSDPDSDLSAFRDFYLKHIWERALFYENLSYKLTGRHINHTLLLHHNLASALFITELVEMFRERGWEVISAQEAFRDPIFDKSPHYAGESLIYALAKDSGKFEDLLRYPAEDSRYEEKEMNDLGL